MSAYKCRICENIENNRRVQLNATLYGTKGKFYYFICRRCGALQICDVPDDIGKYYDTDHYYSFNMNKRGLKNELLYRELKQQYGESNIIGKLLCGIYPIDYSFIKLLKRDNRILDIGCGEGQFLKWLKRLGYTKLYGLEPFIDEDIDSDGIQIMKTDVLGYEGNEKFDAVIMLHALEHIYEQQETVNKIYRILNDGGKLIIQIPFFSRYYWEKYGTDLYTLDPPRHFYIHTYKSLEHLMTSEGFKESYFGTEFDPAIPKMARNIRIGHTERNNGTGFISGTLESIKSRGLRKKLKDEKDGAIATFIFEKVKNEG